MSTTVVEQQDIEALDKSHRCDGCGAQALVRLELTSTGQELVLCGHHFEVNSVALETCARITHDDRAALIPA